MRLLSLTLNKGRNKIDGKKNSCKWKNYKDELEKFNNVQFKVFETVLNNNMIAFECIMKANGILDKDKKFKSLK